MFFIINNVYNKVLFNDNNRQELLRHLKWGPSFKAGFYFFNSNRATYWEHVSKQ